VRSWLRDVLLGSALVTVLLTPPTVSAWVTDPGQVPVRRSLPNAIDLMESSLYWLQDMSGVADPRDPASLVSLMEEQAARFFDFAYMAYLVAGPQYAQMDVLQRSHFQNRVRDRLFTMLARQMGMYDVRMPSFRPLTPVRTSVSTWQAGGVFYHPGGPTIRLTFEFYLTQRGWRIYDVTSNGVSAVATLRNSYLDNQLLER
jgi:ABC-type transporter MlaC component